MSGDSHKDDDQFDDDFLDEDFVVEDIVGKNDDLEDLFTDPAPAEESVAENPANGSGADGSDEQSTGDPDEDDLLFTDHTEGLEPTEEFAGRTFSEDDASEWDGDQLELDEAGDADAVTGDDAAASPELVEATESFTDELDAMLHEEEFSLDGDEELELVDAEDGISEFEQTGPFILEDGDGEWAESLEADEASEELPGEAAAEDLEFDDPVNEPVDAPDTLEPLFGSDQPEEAEEFEALEDLELDAPMSEQLPALEAEPMADEVAAAAADESIVDSYEQQGAFGDGQTVEMSPADFGEPGSLASEAETVEMHQEDLQLDAVDGVADDEQIEEMPLLEAVQGDEAGDEEHWEPLPSTSMDQLSEIDEVQRHEGDEEEPQQEFVEQGFLQQVPAGHDDLEEVEGHDIYADEEAEEEAVVIGGGRRGGAVKLLLSLAASTLLLAGAAAVVVRPEWFGLSVEPERVAAVELQRPKVELDVVEPPTVAIPSVAAPEIGSSTNENTTGEGSATDGEPATSPSEKPQAQPAGPDVGEPSAAPVPVPTVTAPTPWEVMAKAGEQAGWLTSQLRGLMPKKAPQSSTDPIAPIEVTQPIAVATPEGQPVEQNWPVAQEGQEPRPQEQQPTDTPEKLTQFGPGILVGGVKAKEPIRALEGVMPGSRAFAQLNNGNYFIGKVKQVADQSITLRMDSGEVTIATADLASLTRLDSQDYEELQKVTKGFVRLTNNNRLVGGILSKIADDHVILEFRKNRVILPKSAIGEIVPGQQAKAKVRLGVTDEEDDWLRSLAERQLGTGKGVKVAPGGVGGVRSNPPR